MRKLTFEDLPFAIGVILERLDRIEALLSAERTPTIEEDVKMTAEEAARFLDIALPTLYGYVSRRQIPVNKPGKRLYFYKSELTAWVKASRKKTGIEIQEGAEEYMLIKRRNR